MKEEDEANGIITKYQLAQPAFVARTVLPTPFASLISFATSCSSLGLWLGGLVGNAAINSARIGALTSFEVGRVIVEGILLRAGNDVVDSSIGEQGRAAAEGLLDRALSVLHYSITRTSFLVSTGFQVGSTSFASAITISQFFLSGLDAVLGDTETSRAVATIVSLIRRESKSPDTSVDGQKLGLGDLIVGISSFALLQRWGRDKTEQELKERCAMETVWDIVVVNSGPLGHQSIFASKDKTDAATSGLSPTRDQKRARSASFISATGHSEPFEAVEDRHSFSTANSAESVSQSCYSDEETFRRHFTDQLQPGSSVQFLAVSNITDRIQIEVRGDAEADIEPLPGFHLLAVDRQSQWDARSRFMFERSRTKRRRGSFHPETRACDSTDHGQVSDDNVVSKPGTNISISNDLHQKQTSEVLGVGHYIAQSATSNIQDATANILPESEYAIYANQKRPRAPKVEAETQTPPLQAEHITTQHNFGLENTPFRKAMNKSKSVKNLVDFWNRERLRPLRNSYASASPANRTDRFSNGNRTAQKADSSSFLPHDEQDCDINCTPGPTVPKTHSWLRAMGNRPRPSSSSSHQRSKSSTYSITSNTSETSVMLRELPLNDISNEDLVLLQRSATMPGQYPRKNFTSNLARFARLSLGSYGPNFLRLAGIAVAKDFPAADWDPNIPKQHHSFCAYNNLSASSILLSSYVDPEASLHTGTDSNTGLPLVHYVVIDHESKAVILACRGTLGFEDILTDMTAEYVDMTWQSQVFQVHQGVYASAKRLLNLHSGRILTTIKVALEEFEDYGLVLCGHSLGGAVAAMLAILLSHTNTTSAGGGSRFVTSPCSQQPGSTGLPPNRPIHAYAYGPAACVSPALQQASRGLITTIVYGDDIVPYLSLGTLRDLQAVALAFKVDVNDAKAEVRQRVWNGLIDSFRSPGSTLDFSNVNSFLHNFGFDSMRGQLGLGGWLSQSRSTAYDSEEDHWPWSALRSLRASLLGDKLIPPGDVFLVESSPVLQRHAFVSPHQHTQNNINGLKPAVSSSQKTSSTRRPRGLSTAQGLGDDCTHGNKTKDCDDNSMPDHSPSRRSFKPGTRLTVSLVRDVEARFNEVRFTSGMFTDHFPLRYLEALEELGKGLGSE